MGEMLANSTVVFTSTIWGTESKYLPQKKKKKKEMSSCMHIDTKELKGKVKGAAIRKYFFQSQIQKTEKKEWVHGGKIRKREITSSEIGDKG